ncbi:MAG TPA: aminopeptidase P family protein [Candidatus Omnitrophica bacterium]|nr:aminopeptidase P family protein [Candidatus Omnitrophota bacterium]
MEKRFKKRFRKVISSIKRENLDSLFVSSEANILYLTGLRIEGYLLVCSQKIILFTDFRYFLEAKKRTKELGIDLAIYEYDIFRFIANRIKGLLLKKVGFESTHLSYQEFSELKKHLKNVELIPTFLLIEKLRMIKDSQELSLIKKGVSITEEAFSFLESTIYEGLTEKFLAVEAEKFIKLKAEDIAFPPIIAVGKNSSYPHYKTGEAKIRRKEVVLIDLGSKYYGYCSDLTRVFFLSKMPHYLKKIIDIVRKAKELSLKKIKEGVKIKEIDRTARNYIEKKGLGKFFRHSLGHGVGLEVHECPGINPKNEEVLKEGMVITIEPAIYLPDKFGIREETMVLVKNNRGEILDEYS